MSVTDNMNPTFEPSMDFKELPVIQKPEEKTYWRSLDQLADAPEFRILPFEQRLGPIEHFTGMGRHTR